MPKPRTLAKEQRRLARQIATEHARTALTDLGRNPPDLPTAEARDAYRAQISHHIAKLSRAHACSPSLAHVDSARVAGSEPGESGA